jgi:hypothetical protein
MKVVKPDLSKVMSWSTFLKSDYNDKDGGKELYLRAKSFLELYDWCRGIKESYVGMIYPEILGIFLFNIIPGEDVREWIWAVVGDIPPALLPLAAGENPAMVLDAYLGEMQRWVDAVRAGKSISGLLPVNAPPTKEYAEMLGSRLEFIGEEILMTEYEDDLRDDSDGGR